MHSFRFVFSFGLLFGSSLGRNIPWEEVKEKFWGQQIHGNGPYGFGACSEDQVKVLKNIFITAGHMLEQQIIPEALKGDQSPAYNTFFTTNDANAVAAILNDIDAGNLNRSVDTHADITVKPPFFACINEGNDNPSEHEALTGCHNADTGAEYRAHYVRLSEAQEHGDSPAHWLLCPTFFNDTWSNDFPATESCPPLNTESTEFDLTGRAPTQYGLSDSRFAIIMHILGLTYTKNSGTDKIDVNEAVYLETENQINSVASYTYFSSMVAAQCPAYPTFQYEATTGSPKSRLRRRQATTDRRIRPNIVHNPEFSMDNIIGPTRIVDENVDKDLAESIKAVNKVVEREQAEYA